MLACMRAALTLLFISLTMMLLPSAASAQVTNQYPNTDSGAILDSLFCIPNVTRTFNVTSGFFVTDVDLGVLLSHSYRGDLQISLRSPAGTSVEVMRNTGLDANNLNVRFSDEAGANISTHTDDDTTTVPPYQRNFIPRNALSAFDGQNPQGTWTLSICDSQPADTGTFTRADLYITTSSADLSLTKTVNNAAPSTGGAVIYTLTVTNNNTSETTATGITVIDLLPAGVTFVSSSGAYTSGTGLWSVGSLAKGASATLTINATVSATGGTTVNNNAQITASSAFDNDSTPNNGVTSEDDYATASFTVSATLPAPTCAVGATQQIINNGTFSTGTGPSWTAGAIWNGTTTANAFSDTTAGTLARSGLTGLKFGPGPANGAVIQLTQRWNNETPSGSSTSATFTVSVGGVEYARITTPAGGGTSASVTYASGVTGNISTIGENVTPGWRIDLPTTVAATGALTFGFTPGGGTSDDIEIDNVALYTCPPGVLSVTKVSATISDGGFHPTNPKSIPGAIVRYCILVTNTGAGPASTVVAADTLPSTLTYSPGSMLSGTTCAGATTPEDDNSADPDEADPFGMSITGTTITGLTSTLAPGATFAMVFNATVK